MSLFIISADAEFDLDAATAYYKRESVDLAIRFRAMVWQTMEQIAENPGIGRRREPRSPGTDGVRVWRVRGFPSVLVFYRVEGGIVRIARVLHGARDVDRLLGSPEAE